MKNNIDKYDINTRYFKKSIKKYRFQCSLGEISKKTLSTK